MRSFLFLATGFEELEALTVIDVLRRGGMDIKTVSIRSERQVTGAHGITVEADMTFKEADFEGAEWLILPGGMPGAQNLHDFEALGDLLKVHAGKGKVAAICAAPAVVLAPLGILKDREATCYPGFEDQLLAGGARRRDAPVVALNNLITANGPASALRFALAILSNSVGENYAREVGSGMLYYPRSVNFYF